MSTWSEKRGRKREKGEWWLIDLEAQRGRDFVASKLTVWNLKLFKKILTGIPNLSKLSERFESHKELIHVKKKLKRKIFEFPHVKP